jgi:hypothetical protein
VREVRIPSPQLKQKRRKLFNFFEEDERWVVNLLILPV